MYERRQSASLVSLLVVTLLFVWACSSRDHQEASVTTSGGAGSEVSAGSAAPSGPDDSSDLGAGGTVDTGAPPSMNEAGSGDDSSPPELEPAAGGKHEVSSGGAASAGGPPLSMGGTLSTSGGAPSGGAPSGGAPSAGAPAAGGSPATVEPSCDPALDSSTLDMALPCEVSSALYVCRNCHSNPPVKGVFTSYVTYAEIKTNAPQIYGVIKSGTMPWPPYTMSAWQKTTVLKWLGKNGSCALGAEKSCQ
jgi:hypothetical protein